MWRRGKGEKWFNSFDMDCCFTFKQASNFSLQYHPRIKHKGLENKGTDHQLKKPLIVTQILLVSTV